MKRRRYDWRSRNEGRLTVRLTICSVVLAAVTSVVQYAGAKEGTLLQFGGGAGHVLGFDTGVVHIVSHDHLIRIELVGSRDVPPAAEAPASELPAKPLERVTYAGVWDGVTLIYEESARGIFKSEYHIDGGAGEAAIRRIRLRYDLPVRLDANGRLVVSHEAGELVEDAPIAWQDIDGERRSVAVRFHLSAEREVGFWVDQYDRSASLIIDPVLTWNTLLGSSQDDRAYGLAVDGSGNVYVIGQSLATWGSPVSPHHTINWDACVAKLRSDDGSVLWNTFVGGSGSDYGEAIAVDGSGSVYVSGESTSSWGTPVRPYTASTESWAAKLNSSGALVWNTFLGGGGIDYSEAIAVDAASNVYVGGWSTATWGTPLRPYTAGSDGWAAKLGSDGSLVGHSFLGGGGTDQVLGIAVDGAGDVYVAGWATGTWGTPVRAYSASADAFAAKLSGSGPLLWSTFLGGGSADYGTGVCLQGADVVFVGGHSYNTWGSPVRAYTAGGDAFVSKLLTSDGSLTWNTFLGGAGDESCLGIAAGGNGTVAVAGYCDATWGSPFGAYTAGYDVFAATVLGDGKLSWNVILGAGGDDLGYDVAVDGAGSTYIAGYSDSWSGNDDVFVAAVSAAGPVIAEIKSKTSRRGEAATLKGSGFSANKLQNTVYFGAKKATITKAKLTSLKVTIPSKLKKGSVSVKAVTNNLESNAVPFQVK